jgi:hypothetical protein
VIRPGSNNNELDIAITTDQNHVKKKQEETESSASSRSKTEVKFTEFMCFCDGEGVETTRNGVVDKGREVGDMRSAVVCGSDSEQEVVTTEHAVTILWSVCYKEAQDYNTCP